jgi:hypothetical protein
MRVTYIGEGAHGLTNGETYWMSGEMEGPNGQGQMILVNELWQLKSDFMPAEQDSAPPPPSTESVPKVAGPKRIPDAWSYSAYSMWEECGFRYEGVKVLKMPDAPGPGMAEGQTFHTEVAAYIMGHRQTLPTRPIHKDILPVVEHLRAIDTPKTVEQQWGITKDWKTTGWFSRDAHKPTWLRIVLDAGLTYPDDTGDVVDWKTGKRYDHNDDQMEIFAAGYLTYRPWLKHITTRLEYVDTGQEEIAEFTAKEAQQLQVKWTEKARIMLADRDFTPKPGFRCKYCVRAKSAGGDCVFG